MKLATAFALFCSVIFVSCRKDEMVYQNSPVSIEGTWNYIGYSGGLAGFPFISANSTGVYIQLKGSQLIITSGEAAKCMEYQFKADSSSNSYYQLTGLLTTSDTSILLPMADMKIYSVSISNDTLTLYPSMCSDCFTAIYTPSLKHFDCSDNNH